MKSRFWFLFTIEQLFQKLVSLFFRELISSKFWLANKVDFETLSESSYLFETLSKIHDILPKLSELPDKTEPELE